MGDLLYRLNNLVNIGMSSTRFWLELMVLCRVPPLIFYLSGKVKHSRMVGFCFLAVAYIYQIHQQLLWVRIIIFIEKYMSESVRNNQMH